MDILEITGKIPSQQLFMRLFIDLGLTEVSIEKLLQRRIDKLKDLYPGEFISHIYSMTMVDFSFWVKGCSYPIHLDVKDKRQFVPENWGLPASEKDDWAVFDETSVKKILNIGFTSFAVIQDLNLKTIYVWNSQLIGLSHKRWAIREDIGGGFRKYKLLYPVSEAEKYTNLGDMIVFMVEWVNHKAYELSNSSYRHTWFNPKWEKCVVNRQQRTPQHRITDLLQSNLTSITSK